MQEKIELLSGENEGMKNSIAAKNEEMKSVNEKFEE